MKTEWSDLPNAKYIDRIISDLKANPKNWAAVYDAIFDNTSYTVTYSAVWSAASDAAWSAALSAALSAVWSAASDAAYYDARYAANGAILALIAYDDCAYLLDENPEYVQMIALLSDIPPAILLYPACIALQKSKIT